MPPLSGDGQMHATSADIVEAMAVAYGDALHANAGATSPKRFQGRMAIRPQAQIRRQYQSDVGLNIHIMSSKLN